MRTLKDLAKELLDTITNGGPAAENLNLGRLDAVARGIYSIAMSNDSPERRPADHSNFKTEDDYLRWVGKKDPILIHGHLLPQRFANYADKLTPAQARQISGCSYTPDGRVAFWP